MGKTPERDNISFWETGNIPWISISDMKSGKVLLSTKEKITEKAFKEKFDSVYSVAGTLIMSFKLTVGKTSILGIDAVHNEAIISIFPYLSYDNIIRDYLLKTLEGLVQFVDKRDAIKGITLNSKKLDKILIPLPPIEEQRRLLDFWGKTENEIINLEQNQTDYIYLMDILKKAILQSAIQGTLVEQCADDEPASVLLEKIRAEKKAQLGKKYLESYIYKGSDNRYYEQIGSKAIDITEEIPYDLPDKWCWARWGDISESIQYGYNAPAKEKGRIKMVRISDIQNGKVVWETVPYCDIDEADIENYTLKAGDILFARTGGTVGKSYLVTEVPEESIYAGYLIRTRYSNKFSSQYLKYYMETNLYWLQLTNGTTATAQPNCNGKTLGKMLLPIPPLAEQERIVSKINEIFAQL